MQCYRVQWWQPQGLCQAIPPSPPGGCSPSTSCHASLPCLPGLPALGARQDTGQAAQSDRTAGDRPKYHQWGDSRNGAAIGTPSPGLALGPGPTWRPGGSPGPRGMHVHSRLMPTAQHGACSSCHHPLAGQLLPKGRGQQQGAVHGISGPVSVVPHPCVSTCIRHFLGGQDWTAGLVPPALV